MMVPVKSSDNKSHLIVNTASGSYSKRQMAKLVRRLSEIGISPNIHLVTTLEQAKADCITIQQSEENPFLIVASGDGTINSVLNGLNPGKATLALIPFGTQNVLARELGICSINDAINSINRGITKQLSVGVLEMEGKCRNFSLMTGIGIDGSVVRDVSRLEKQIFKQFAYVFSTFRQLLAWDRELVLVQQGDNSILCHSVLISNASRYGGNFKFVPEQDVTRPDLTVICITDNLRRTYFRLLLGVLLKNKRVDCAIRCFTTNTLTVCGNKPIQVDGDFIGNGSVNISVIEGFVRIFA